MNVVAELIILLLHVLEVLCLNLVPETDHMAGVFHGVHPFKKYNAVYFKTGSDFFFAQLFKSSITMYHVITFPVKQKWCRESLYNDIMVLFKLVVIYSLALSAYLNTISND
jgi:hypothetical protein